MSSIKFKFFFLFFLCLFVAFNTIAQSNWNFKLNSFAAKSEFKSSGDYAWNESEPAFSFQPGIVIAYEFFVYDRDLSMRLQNGFISYENGMVDVLSSSLHYTVYNKWKSALNLSIGGAFAYDLSDNDNGGSLPYIIAGVEYNRSLNRKLDLSVSASHMYMNRISLQAGIRYWISKDVRQKHGCLACPD